MNNRLTLCALIATSLVCSARLLAQEEPTTAPTTQMTRPVGPIDPQSINSAAMMEKLTTESARLLKEKKLVPFSEFARQLDRHSARVSLLPAGGAATRPQEIYTRCSPSVFVIGSLHDKPSLHAHEASGFVISSSGVAVTNFHVVGSKESAGYPGAVAMMRDGQVYAIKEVLAASEQYDIAIIQLDGKDFTPLAIAPRADVGSPAYLISHPTARLWYFSSGMVSGYGTGVRRTDPVDTLQVTADYARGSSGAPILSEAGEVIGMVSSTSSIYANAQRGQQRDFQLVFHNCVTSAQILSLVENTAK